MTEMDGSANESEHPVRPILPPRLARQAAGQHTADVLMLGGGALVLFVVIPIVVIACWIMTGWVGALIAAAIGAIAYFVIIVTAHALSQRAHREEDAVLASMSAEDDAREQAEIAAYEQANAAYLQQVEERNRQAREARQAEIDARETEIDAKLDSAIRGDGRELVGAFADLPRGPLEVRQWLSRNEQAIEQLGRELTVDERIVHVAVAQTEGFKVVGIVLTDARLVIIERGAHNWVHRDELQAATTMPSTRGRYLEITTRYEKYKWWKVHPKEAADALATCVRTGEVPVPGATHSASSYGSVVAKTTAKFLGGSFVGSAARSRSTLAPKLRDGTTVKVELTDRDELLIRDGAQLLARYGVADTCLQIDVSTKIGRGLRKGRLAATAAATLALHPIALAGLAGSTAKRTEEAFALAIDDGEDFALLSLSDSPVGRRMVARRSALRPTATAAERDRDATSAPVIDQVERLASLRSQGAISDDEFEQMKRQVLGGE